MKHAVGDAYEIRKRNVHARFHLEHEAYRKLVVAVDALDAEKAKRFPAVFSSNKSFRKKIADQRKKLNQENAAYKKTVTATHRANRALEAYLVEKNPTIDNGPANARKAALERARLKHQKDAAYQELVFAAAAAQSKLERDYPQLFVSDDAIKAKREAARQAAKEDPAFKAMVDRRAAAYRAQQDYLNENDARLAQLKAQVEAAKDKK